MRWVAVAAALVVLSAGCSDDADPTSVEPAEETTSTGGPIETTPVTTVTAPVVPPCPVEVEPLDTSPDENGIRPFPTFVPQYHYVGMTLDDVQCEADLREVRLRVWKVDGEEVAPEAASGGYVNLTLVDGLITVAEFAPSP